MEGVLYKWTNYYNGWQPRWFVLDGGVLSYYDHKEDVRKGSKGSLKMAVCEIQVCPSDDSRLELVIPGEQHFYLRTTSAAERQGWVVALGSAKACLTDSRTRKEKEIMEASDSLCSKMSEMRLYYDLMTQQVSLIRQGIQEPRPDVQRMSEASSLLSATCDTFVRALEECVHTAASSDLTHTQQHRPPPAPSSSPRCETQRRLPACINDGHFDDADDGNDADDGDVGTAGRGEEGGAGENSDAGHVADRGFDPETLGEGEDCRGEGEDCRGEGEDRGGEGEGPGVDGEDAGGEGEDGGGEDAGGETVETFFGVMAQRFSDAELQDEQGIHVEPFLRACASIVPVLDKLGPTAFAPVKLDFVGNIRKITQKYETDRAAFPTLQSIVRHELSSGTALVRNSTTEALLWLRRGLKFLLELLTEVREGQANLHVALSNAYGRTLRRYHGWVVRGVFALALRAAPALDGFLAALTAREGDPTGPEFRAQLNRDLDTYLGAMRAQLGALDHLYAQNQLESDRVV
ncbi:unnamed protein product [Lampetra fluviatilis]